MQLRIRSAGAVAVFFATCFAIALASQMTSGGAAPEKPKVRLSLYIHPTSLAVARAGGSGEFVADAVASGTFSGTISGHIQFVFTQSTPPELRLGLASPNHALYPFKLRALESTATVTPQQTARFVVKTDPKNKASGTVTYTVFVFPDEDDENVETHFSPQTVTVHVQ